MATPASPSNCSDGLFFATSPLSANMNNNAHNRPSHLSNHLMSSNQQHQTQLNLSLPLTLSPSPGHHSPSTSGHHHRLQMSKDGSPTIHLDDATQSQLRLQILLDLYVVGNSRTSEQGALQLLRMCDRLFAGFLQRMGRLLQLLGWLPQAQLAPLRPLEQALQDLQTHGCTRPTTTTNEERIHLSLATLDAQQLFSYMFSLLLCILLPVEEDNWTQFLRVSCAKFNNCLRLAWSETQFRALLRLLRPPFDRLQHYRHLLCARSSLFEQELLNCIEHNAFANGLLKEMCYHFLSIKQAPGTLS